MDINDEGKEGVQDLCTAINEAIRDSSLVAIAIERLREAGYEMELTLKLEIAVRPLDEEMEAESSNSQATLELSDDDMKTLRSMRIRIDDGD